MAHSQLYFAYLFIYFLSYIMKNVISWCLGFFFSFDYIGTFDCSIMTALDLDLDFFFFLI